MGEEDISCSLASDVWFGVAACLCCDEVLTGNPYEEQDSLRMVNSGVQMPCRLGHLHHEVGP